MAPSYTASPIQDQEKSSLSAQPGHDDDRRFHSFDGALPGWTSSRLADCFANFTMCAPCSTYEPQPGKLPTTGDLPRPFLTRPTVSV